MTLRLDRLKEMEVKKTPFGYMHEDEVHSMIQNYNMALSEFTKQIDELTMMNQHLESKYKAECVRSRQLSEEVKSLQLQLEKTQMEEENLRRMNQVMTTAMHATPPTTAWVDTKQQLLRMYENLSTKEEIEAALAKSELIFNSLEGQNAVLRSEVQQLEAHLAERKQQDSRESRCLKCHRNFIPLSNTDSSCHFHPGKLKYYSCKGCGDDQYFTCCNRCERCSPGCKLGRHVQV